MIEIREVQTKREMGIFIKFPYKFYKKHPYWVPSLLMDEKNTLDKEKNGAFESAQARFWLAWKDGRPVRTGCGYFSGKV